MGRVETRAPSDTCLWWYHVDAIISFFAHPRAQYERTHQRQSTREKGTGQFNADSIPRYTHSRTVRPPVYRVPYTSLWANSFYYAVVIYFSHFIFTHSLTSIIFFPMTNYVAKIIKRVSLIFRTTKNSSSTKITLETKTCSAGIVAVVTKDKVFTPLDNYVNWGWWFFN